MATNRNIQMNYFNGVDYDMLNPRTTVGNISDWNSVIYSKGEVDSKDSTIQSNLMGEISNIQNSLDSILDVNNGTYITSTISGEVDKKKARKYNYLKELLIILFYML